MENEDSRLELTEAPLAGCRDWFNVEPNYFISLVEGL